MAKNEWVEQALDDDFGSIESFDDDDDYRGNFFLDFNEQTAMKSQ